jgi:hypothetical protein
VDAYLVGYAVQLGRQGLSGGDDEQDVAQPTPVGVAMPLRERVGAGVDCDGQRTGITISDGDDKASVTGADVDDDPGMGGNKLPDIDVSELPAMNDAHERRIRARAAGGHTFRTADRLRAPGPPYTVTDVRTPCCLASRDSGLRAASRTHSTLTSRAQTLAVNQPFNCCRNYYL